MSVPLFSPVFSAVEEFDISKRGVQGIEELKVQLAHRRVWMVSSIHRGEEEGQSLVVGLCYFFVIFFSLWCLVCLKIYCRVIL